MNILKQLESAIVGFRTASKNEKSEVGEQVAYEFCADTIENISKEYMKQVEDSTSELKRLCADIKAVSLPYGESWIDRINKAIRKLDNDEDE